MSSNNEIKLLYNIFTVLGPKYSILQFHLGIPFFIYKNSPKKCIFLV